MSDEMKTQVAFQLKHEMIAIARENGIDTFEEVFSFRYGVGCLFVSLFCIIVVGTTNQPAFLNAPLLLTSVLYLFLGGYHVDKATAPSRRLRQKIRKQRLPWQA